MATRVYALQTNDTTGGAQIAFLDFKARGKLVGALFTIAATAAAAGERILGEVSFNGMAQTVLAPTNDVQGIIISGLAYLDGAGAAADTYGSQTFVNNLNIPVAPGNRVYMHTVITGGPSVAVTQCLLYVEE